MNPPARVLTLVVALAAAGAAASFAVAQSANTLTIHRSDAAIRLVNEGRADEGARTLLNLPGCVPDRPVRSSVFYGPEGGVTATITPSEGDDDPTVVHAPLMMVQEPEGGPQDGDDGSSGAASGGDAGGVAGEADDASDAGAAGREDEPAAGADDQATLEALDATTEFPGRPPCPEGIRPADRPAVRLEQGRTAVTGGRFFLDRGSDVATMDGPVSLIRAPAGDGPAVEADADALRFDLESDRQTLTGNVTVRAGGRVSEADELELDERAGVAILRGSPAVSREGPDEVAGDRLIYDLETNDVTIQGAVRATFQRD